MNYRNTVNFLSPQQQQPQTNKNDTNKRNNNSNKRNNNNERKNQISLGQFLAVFILVERDHSFDALAEFVPLTFLLLDDAGLLRSLIVLERREREDRWHDAGRGRSHGVAEPAAMQSEPLRLRIRLRFDAVRRTRSLAAMIPRHVKELE